MTTGQLRLRATTSGPHEASEAASEWLFVAGRRFLVALPVSVPPESVEKFSALVDLTDVSAEALVARVPSTSPDAPFALVALGPEVDAVAGHTGERELDEPAETTITSVVRGPIAVDVFSVGGWRRFTDHDARPWMLADFRSVTAVVIGGTEIPMVPLAESLDGSVPADSIARGHQLVWSLTRIEPAAVEQPYEPEPAAQETSSQETSSQETSSQETSSQEAFEQTYEREPAAQDAFSQDASEQMYERAPFDRHAFDQDAFDPDAFDPDAGISPESHMDRPPTAHYRFRIGNSDAIALNADAYIGRKPRVPRIPTASSPQLVPVSSPRREVSGTHVKIAQEGNVVVVTDLGSLNGTIVSIPGSRAMRLRQSESVVVTPGTRLDIGDGNIIEILSIVT